LSYSPHKTETIVAAGKSLADAAGVIILLHGRGGSAADMLGLGQAISPSGWAMLAPEAAGHSWYPYSFLEPRERNEPYLTSALEQVQAAIDMALRAGIPAEKIVVAGFSQGACLATEFVGRNPRKYGALVAFTGGLMGPLDAALELSGDLAGTPTLLSSGDPDSHVPWARVAKSAELLTAIGGRIELHRFPGRPHTILAEEMDIARELLSQI
jgi:phospholipase/carboxylesterase